MSNKITVTETKINGLTVFQVRYDGALLNQCLSLALANTKAILYKNKLRGI